MHDLKKPLPFPGNTFLKIYASHVLEHFYYRELIRLLKEVYRILKVGGTFSICVPDASIYIKAYCHPETFDADFYCRYKPAVNVYSRIDYVNYMAYMAGHHKIMFDEENLPGILKAVGFGNVRKRNFDPELDLKKRDYESIYFIAEK
jgi:predicted SAM-dependent methyltransferase